MILIAGLNNMDAGSYFEGSKDVVVIAAKHAVTFGKSASVRTMLGLRVRIPPGHGYLYLVSVVCCQVEVSLSLHV